MSDTVIDPGPDDGHRPTVTDDATVDATVDAPPPTVPNAEGLRPTVVDNSAPEAPGAAAQPRPASRRSRVGCAVAAIVLTVAALVAAALGFYFFVWRYEPVAHRHIPGGANVAFRIDAAEIALFGPVRKHLWPLLDEAPAGKRRSARLREATGVNPATDLREILVASTDAASWVVLLGGRIGPGRFVAGLERVAREEGWVGWQRQGEVFVGPAGLTVAQAEDGTVVIGTDAPIVRASLTPSDEWRRLGLPEQGALTFVVTRDAWDGIGKEIGGMLPRGGRGLFLRAGRASGAMALGQAPELTMRVEPASGETAAALAGDVEAVVGGLRIVMLLLPDQVGEKAALQSAQVKAAPDAVEIRAPWPLDGLDRACERLARRLRGPGSG